MDKRSTAARDHAPSECLCGGEIAGEVHGKHGRPVSLRYALQPTGPQDTGIVDEDVNPALPLHPICGCRNVRCLGDVAGDRERAASEFRDERRGAFLITIEQESETFPVFEHPGTEFIYMLEGRIEYRHGKTVYDLQPGDALTFDGNVPHGPEKLTKVPIRFLSITIYPEAGHE